MIRYLFSWSTILSNKRIVYSNLSPARLHLGGVILHQDLVDQVLPGKDDTRGPGKGGGALKEVNQSESSIHVKR